MGPELHPSPGLPGRVDAEGGGAATGKDALPHMGRPGAGNAGRVWLASPPLGAVTPVAVSAPVPAALVPDRGQFWAPGPCALAVVGGIDEWAAVLLLRSKAPHSGTSLLRPTPSPSLGLWRGVLGDSSATPKHGEGGGI